MSDKKAMGPGNVSNLTTIIFEVIQTAEAEEGCEVAGGKNRKGLRTAHCRKTADSRDGPSGAVPDKTMEAAHGCVGADRCGQDVFKRQSVFRKAGLEACVSHEKRV